MPAKETTSTEAPFSVTFKVETPGGVELLITTRPQAITPEQQFEAVRDIDQFATELLDAGFKAVKGFQGYGNKGGGGGSAAAAPAVAADPSVAGRCDCPGTPVRVLKSGFSKKNGKAWTGYFCAANNRDCPTKWA